VLIEVIFFSFKPATAAPCLQ